MLTDQEVFGQLSRAVAALEAVENWPPAKGLVRAFEHALDGVTRRFLNEPHVSSDGYISRELSRARGGIFSAGDLYVLSGNASPSPLTRRTETQLSSTRGGWIHVSSEAEQHAFESLTRRQQAATTRLERWTHAVDVPDALSLGNWRTS